MSASLLPAVDEVRQPPGGIGSGYGYNVRGFLAPLSRIDGVIADHQLSAIVACGYHDQNIDPFKLIGIGSLYSDERLIFII